MGESTDDLADGFSKYRDEIKALTGFDIMKNEDEYKSMYEIFVGLAQVWDDMKSDEARARVSEILGGTRNLSGIASTIQNISDAIGAYEVALNSAGVAEEANAKHMETTEAHIGQFKASFQELSYDVFNSDAMKMFVDTGKAVIDTIDFLVDSFGAAQTAMGLFTGGFLAFNALKTNLIPSLSLFGSTLKGITSTIAEKGFLAGLSSLTGLSTLAVGGITAAALAIPLAIKGYQAYQQHLEELRQASQQSSKSYMEQADSFEASYKKVTELRQQLDSGTLSSTEEYQVRSQILDIQNQMVDTYGAQAAGLDLVNGKLEQQQTMMKALNVESAEQLLNYDIDKKTLDKATEVMEGAYGGKNGKLLGSHSFDAKSNSQKELKALKDIVGKYQDVLKLSDDVDENGYRATVRYTGKAKDIRENLSGFMDDLREASKTLGGDTPHIDAYIKSTQAAVSEADSLLSQYEDIYNAAKRAELVSDKGAFADKNGNKKSAYDWLNDYSDAITNYNNALLGGDKQERLDAANSFREIDDSISGMTGGGGSLEKYKEQFNEVRDTLNEAGAKQEELSEILAGDYVSDATKDVKKYGDALKALGLSDADFMNAFLGKQDKNHGAIKSFIDAVKEAGYISSDSQTDVEQLAHTLVSIGTIAGTSATGLANFSMSVEDLQTMVDEYSAFNKDLQTAFDKSKDGTGLLVDDVNKLTEAYKGLDSYNPAELFEHTYDGIHLNNEALKQLNQELSDSKLKTLNDALLERQNALLNGAGDRGEIQGQISDIQNLISVYEGLNSAYNQYLNAKSGKNERDSYNTLGSDYANMKDLLDQGWYGDDSLNAYVNLMAGAGRGVDDVAERFDSLSQKIEGTNHAFMDYFKFMDDEGNITTPLSKDGAKGNLVSDGLIDFAEDVRSIFGDDYSQLMDDGTYKLDLMGGKLEEVAGRFGTSAEAIQLMERAMIDAGAAMVLDNNNFDAMTQQLRNVQDGFEGLKDVDFSFDVQNMSADELSAKRQELENAKATIDVDTEGAGEAIQMIDSLISSIEGKEYQLQIQAKVDEQGLKVEDLVNASDQTITETFDVKGEEEIQRVRDALSELSGEGGEVSIPVKIDESQFSQITSMFDTAPIEVPVEPQLESQPDLSVEPVEMPVTPVVTEETPAIATEDQEVSVHYAVEADPEPNYPNIERTTHYAVVADPVPSYPNISRTVTYTIQTVGSVPSGGGRASGTMTSVGVAHANGTAYNAPWNWINAYANGKVSLPKNEVALVNELGTESIIFICDFIQQCISNNLFNCWETLRAKYTTA